MEAYNRNYNYIGSNDKQKKYTKYIHEKIGRLNFIAYIHDSMYKIILKIENVWLFLICKFLVDLMFLICGVFLNIFRLNLYLGVQGVVLTILLYLLLIVYTPSYTVKHFWNTKKVRWY